MRNYITSLMKTFNDGDIDMGARNTFTHITVKSQVALADGIWWDTFKANKWHHIAAIRPVHTITSQAGAIINDMLYGLIHVT